MDPKQFRRRLHFTGLLLGAMMALFFSVLYSLQVVNGVEYRTQSVHSITRTETVEAARGQILDRYGRVLISNETGYEVTLDPSVMGAEEERNPNLLTLLEICREQGVEWTDQVLPITMEEPFTYTDTLSENGRARYERFLEEMKWTAAAQEGPDALLEAMRSFYKVDPAVPPRDGRALVGVLCELRIRSMDILRTAYLFADDVEINFISAVKEHSLSGVTIRPTATRVYHTSHAAQLLGRVAKMNSEEWEVYKDLGYSMDDTVGKEGVEKAFESYLRGEPGMRSIDTNLNGKVVGERWLTDEETGETLEPKPGGNVTLTLDIRLQEAVEGFLETGIQNLPSEYTQGGAAVVVDVDTGGVLAMASYPTYDISRVYSDAALYKEVSANPLNPFYNRASNGRYSPGSTFKMIVGTAALQEGLTTPTEKIRDTGRFQYPEGEKYPYGEYHPGCWIYLQYGGTHGLEDMAHAIKDSCNVYFYTLGDRLGIDKLGEYAAMFGLGKSTGFELGEYTGQVAGPGTSDTWYGGDLLSASIGQGDTLASPLQLANYIATLVNGGSHYSAHLLQSVKSSDFSQVLYQRESELLDQLDISPENLSAVKRGMNLLTTEGTLAPYFSGLPFQVGAKTGTAQVGREDTEANAVLVCFAPYEDPEVAVAIVAERGGSGTELGAIAADILSYYFNTEGGMGAVKEENTLLH